jgi:hypothetical protein
MPNSGTKTSASRFEARLRDGADNPSPDAWVDLASTMPTSNFTLAFDGSNNKEFTLNSLYVGLAASLIDGLLSIPFEGDARFIAYDPDGKPVAGLTKRFTPTLENFLYANMTKVTFGSDFSRIATVAVRLDSLRVSNVIRLDRNSGIAVAIEMDTIDVTTYPKQTAN